MSDENEKPPEEEAPPAGTADSNVNQHAPEPKPPIDGESQRLREEIPENMIKGIAKAGFGPEHIVSSASYDAQEMWCVVCDDGKRHPKLEISFEGEYLNPPPPKKKQEKK